MNWRSLPKVELHLHMDISLSVEAALQLEPSLTRETFAREFTAPAKCSNLADFLGRVSRVLNLLQTKHALELLVQDVFRQLVEDHVIYCELRFAPLLHTQMGLSPKEVVSFVEAAVDAARGAFEQALAVNAWISAALMLVAAALMAVVSRQEN